MKHNSKRKKALKAAGVSLGAAALFGTGALTAFALSLGTTQVGDFLDNNAKLVSISQKVDALSKKEAAERSQIATLTQDKADLQTQLNSANSSLQAKASSVPKATLDAAVSNHDNMEQVAIQGRMALMQARTQNTADNGAEAELEAQLDAALTASGASASSGTSKITKGLPTPPTGGGVPKSNAEKTNDNIARFNKAITDYDTSKQTVTAP